jgi:hypothetical protein
MDRVGFARDGEWARTGAPLERAGGWGIPSPDRTYRTGENVPFYFEAYNLERDVDGLVRYSVHITIENSRPPHWRMTRPALIDLKEPPEPRVETRFDEAAPAGDLKRMLDLEVGALPPNSYRLKLEITDRIGGGTAASSVVFKVVNDPDLSRK